MPSKEFVGAGAGTPPAIIVLKKIWHEDRNKWYIYMMLARARGLYRGYGGASCRSIYAFRRHTRCLV